MSERDDAIVLAHRILDRPFADPDDDLAVLARRLTRMAEPTSGKAVEGGEMREALQEAFEAGAAWRRNQECLGLRTTPDAAEAYVRSLLYRRAARGPFCSSGSQQQTVLEEENVARAYHDGAMAAIGCEPWDDASDFFALVGRDYANGKPLPSTMPSPRPHSACETGAEDSA